jgi:ABC-type branched-subunit amino acid transport system substrate-binding protein
VGPAATILQQMQELGMKQRVFGSHRTVGDELLKLGAAAEGFEAVYPYDPTRSDPRWLDFVARYEARFHERPDHFAALAYDQMQILLQAICRAGLNRGRIRDALTGITNYKGVTGDMVFDPNCKNISPLFLASVHHGAIEYHRITMEKPYARVGDGGVGYSGPPTADSNSQELRIAVFGPNADRAVESAPIIQMLKSLDASGQHFKLVAVPTESSWGKASTALVQAVVQDHALGIIALDRDSSHLAEQIAVKTFVPVIAISSDKMLTSTNIPWIFRLPAGSDLPDAVRVFTQAAKAAGANRGKVREFLASGTSIAGVRFSSSGEVQ